MMIWKKLLEIIKNQNGNLELLPKSSNKYEIKSMTEGYLIDMDAYKLGILSMSLGAGRKNKEDNIDYSAGIIVHKNILCRCKKICFFCKKDYRPRHRSKISVRYIYNIVTASFFKLCPDFTEAVIERSIDAASAVSAFIVSG